MVDIAAPLKPHQVEVLRWVEAGCPDPGMPGDGAKHTARASQGRRLVTASRRDGRWSATLTERGRYYLDNGRYPAVTSTATSDLLESSPTQATSGGKSRQPTAQPSVIQEATVLIERLQTSGGTVVVSDPDADTRASGAPSTLPSSTNSCPTATTCGTPAATPVTSSFVCTQRRSPMTPIGHERDRITPHTIRPVVERPLHPSEIPVREIKVRRRWW